MTYNERKERIRQEAINWQITASEENYSYEAYAAAADYYSKYGKRYGLLKEFRENGIC